MDRQDQIALIDAAAGKYGSMRAVAKRLGLQPLAVYRWRYGTRPMRRIAELALLELLTGDHDETERGGQNGR